MKTNHLFIFLFIVLLFANCGSNAYEQLDKVTGLNLFDENAAAIGRWNIPNDKRGESTVFPNPSSGIISLFSTFDVNNIWVIEAECSASDDAEILELSDELSYNIDELLTLSILTVELAALNQVTLDMTQFSAGFYKVFYQSESGELFWQNIYIDPGVVTFIDFSILDAACSG